MKKANSYKRTLEGAAGLTLIVVILLVGSINDASEKNDKVSVFQLVLLVASLGSAIWYWIKGARQYIDFRFQELKKEKSV